MDLEEQIPQTSRSGLAWTLAAFAAMALLALWIVHQKQKDQAKSDAIHTAEKQLDGDSDALKAERAKLDDLTKQVEDLRMQITNHAVKDGKKAVEQFNKLAADQRAEREKYVQMADQYNQKVAKVRELAQE